MNATSPPPVNKRPLWRALLALMVLVVFVIGCFIVMAFIPPKRLLVENFSQVRIGMTQTQVEALLGGPPGHYVKDTTPLFFAVLVSVPPPGCIRKIWTDNTVMLEIDFNIQHCVRDYHQSSNFTVIPVPGYWSQVRHWIRDTTGY